jgi:hypothetical protein
MPDKNNSLKAALEALQKIDPDKLPKVSLSPAVQKIAESLKPSGQLQRFAERLKGRQPEPPKRKHKPAQATPSISARARASGIRSNAELA